MAVSIPLQNQPLKKTLFLPLSTQTTCFGHVVSKIARMQMAIDKAKLYGIGMTVVNNSTHYGIAGYYSMMAAKQGLLGFSMTNTEGMVVPTFGKLP